MNDLLRPSMYGATHEIMPAYTGKLLAALETEHPESDAKRYQSAVLSVQPLIEPLSQRELEILQLICNLERVNNQHGIRLLCN